MIIYLTGVPGAGKTYFAVNQIFDYVKLNKYTCIYTNIDQFNFDKFSIVKPFNWDDFYPIVLELFSIYKNKNTNDDDLISYLKNLNFYKSYFVIDEAHNYLDTLDPAVSWLFSYHRHLFIDFLLVTQNLALIDSKYKKFAEYFIRAVPTSLQLFNKKFTYKKFIDSRLSQKSFAGKESIKKDKLIFDLYNSGDTVKTTNIIKKYLIWFFIGSVFVFFAFKFFLNTMKGGHNVKVNKKVIQRVSLPVSSDKSGLFQKRYKQVSLDTNNSKFKYVSIHCILNRCYYRSSFVSSYFIYVLIKKTHSEIISLNSINSNNFYIFLNASNSFLNSFKGATNDFIPSVSNSDTVFKTYRQ